MGEQEVTSVAGSAVRCTGWPDAGHAALVIATMHGRMSVCPICGRRFRREDPVKVDPAAWPREE